MCTQLNLICNVYNIHSSGKTQRSDENVWGRHSCSAVYKYKNSSKKT